MMGTLNLEYNAFGLDDPKLIHVHELLHDYDPNLSLRRIRPDDDVLGFTRLNPGPPHEYGVWEENVAPGERHWVFTVPKMSVDERLLARIMENDMKRHGASERMARLQAFESAKAASLLKREADRRAERREEMLAIGRLADQKSEFRHRFADGTKKIIGGEPGMRDIGTTVPQNRSIKMAKEFKRA